MYPGQEIKALKRMPESGELGKAHSGSEILGLGCTGESLELFKGAPKPFPRPTVPSLGAPRMF